MTSDFFNPLNPEDFGEVIWRFGHLISSWCPSNPTPEQLKAYKDIFSGLTKVMPLGCDTCGQHYAEFFHRRSDTATSSCSMDPFLTLHNQKMYPFRQWWLNAHNNANKILSRRPWTLEELDRKWVPRDQLLLELKQQQSTVGTANASGIVGAERKTQTQTQSQRKLAPAIAGAKLLQGQIVPSNTTGSTLTTPTSMQILRGQRPRSALPYPSSSHRRHHMPLRATVIYIVIIFILVIFVIITSSFAITAFKDTNAAITAVSAAILFFTLLFLVIFVIVLIVQFVQSRYYVYNRPAAAAAVVAVSSPPPQQRPALLPCGP